MPGNFVKVTLKDETRRLEVPEDASFSSLKNLVAERFGLDTDEFGIQHKDEEGDLVTISCDVEMREIFEFAGPKTTIRLVVNLVQADAMQADDGFEKKDENSHSDVDEKHRRKHAKKHGKKEEKQCKKEAFKRQLLDELRKELASQATPRAESKEAGTHPDGSAPLPTQVPTGEHLQALLQAFVEVSGTPAERVYAYVNSLTAEQVKSAFTSTGMWGMLKGMFGSGFNPSTAGPPPPHFGHRHYGHGHGPHRGPPPFPPHGFPAHPGHHFPPPPPPHGAPPPHGVPPPAPHFGMPPPPPGMPLPPPGMQPPGMPPPPPGMQLPRVPPPSHEMPPPPPFFSPQPHHGYHGPAGGAFGGSGLEGSLLGQMMSGQGSFLDQFMGRRHCGRHGGRHGGGSFWRSMRLEDMVAPAAPLQVGSMGDEVVALQKTLAVLGYLSCGPWYFYRKHFDHKTYDAVCSFQHHNGLSCTGVYDDAMRSVIAGRIDAAVRVAGDSGSYTRKNGFAGDESPSVEFNDTDGNFVAFVSSKDGSGVTQYFNGALDVDKVQCVSLEEESGFVSNMNRSVYMKESDRGVKMPALRALFRDAGVEVQLLPSASMKEADEASELAAAAAAAAATAATAAAARVAAAAAAWSARPSPSAYSMEDEYKPFQGFGIFANLFGPVTGAAGGGPEEEKGKEDDKKEEVKGGEAGKGKEGWEYEGEMLQVLEMGFEDVQRIRELLQIYKGDVSRVVQALSAAASV